METLLRFMPKRYNFFSLSVGVSFGMVGERRTRCASCIILYENLNIGRIEFEGS